MRIDIKDVRSNRSGIAALAFILILVSFSMIIMQAGVQLTQTSPFGAAGPKFVTLAGLSATRHPLELQGSLLARSTDHEITELIFTLVNNGSAKPIKLTDDTLTLSYRDPFQQVAHLTWSKRFQGNHNPDDLLDQGELVQLTVHLSGALSTKLGPNTSFVIDVTPAQGARFSINRTTPGDFTPIMDFN